MVQGPLVDEEAGDDRLEAGCEQAHAQLGVKGSRCWTAHGSHVEEQAGEDGGRKMYANSCAHCLRDLEWRKEEREELDGTGIARGRGGGQGWRPELRCQLAHVSSERARLRCAPGTWNRGMEEVEKVDGAGISRGRGGR